jgi:multidrug efflux pump subunit AcrA (membrane-fusion protein)
VVLSTGASEQLVVPLAALQRDVAGEFVYVYQAAGGTVRRAGVASGLRLADRVEIRDGLERGAQVVVKGFLGIAAGQRVKPVEPRAAREG